MAKNCLIKNDYLVVRLNGDLDHHVIELLRKEIDDELLHNRIINIAFDFKKVGFMDSSGIGLLMGRYRKITPLGGIIYVSNMNYSIQRIFKLSGLCSITKHSSEVDYIVNEEECDE